MTDGQCDAKPVVTVSAVRFILCYYHAAAAAAADDDDDDIDDRFGFHTAPSSRSLSKLITSMRG